MLDATARLQLVLDFKKHQNVSKVARMHGTSRETVRHWVRTHEETGTVAHVAAGGRPRSLDAAARQQAMEMLLGDGFRGTEHVAQELHARGLTERIVNRTTVARAVHAWAKEQTGKRIRVWRGDNQLERELTSQQKAKRVEFAKANVKRNWALVMATDRKKFYFKYPGVHKKTCYWSPVGQRPKVNKVNNPMCVNVYAGITKFGITKVHFVAGTSKLKGQHSNLKGQPARNITKSEYKEVLEQTLLPEGNRLFRNKDKSSWVFLQDNDPTHRCAKEVIDAWNQANPGVTVSLLSGWPGNSPDLNPIENLWAKVQAEVDAKGCKTFEEFKDSVEKTLKNVPREQLANLMGSMQARLKLCIEKAGDKTGY